MSCTLDQIRAMTRELIDAHRDIIPILGGGSPAEKPVLHPEKGSDKEDHIDPGQADNL